MPKWFGTMSMIMPSPAKRALVMSRSSASTPTSVLIDTGDISRVVTMIRTNRRLQYR